jgi:hypothetical protein
MAFRGLSDPAFQGAVFLLLFFSGVTMITKRPTAWGALFAKQDCLILGY